MNAARTVASLCAIALLATNAAHVQAGFVNGDFSTSVPSNGTGGSWTSSNIDSAGGWRSTGGNPDGHFILNDNGDALTDPTIQQLVGGLTVGSLYRLSWDYAVHVNYSGANGHSFGVFLDSQVFANALFIGENLLSTYVSESVDFFATSTSHTFFFAAELDNRTNGSAGVSDVSHQLDNVALALAPPTVVPELGTTLMASLAVATILSTAVSYRFLTGSKLFS